MMTKGLLLFLLMFEATWVTAQPNYDASLIPKELLPYASAVFRNKEVNIEVKDLDNTIYHIKEAITVLNRNGDDLAHMVIEHDKINTIKYIKGVVFNSFGRQTSKFSESDFDDVSAGNNFSLFEDVRVKHYLPSVTDYPYTIAYEYEQRSKQSLNLEQWRPNSQTGVAVEKSSFTFICKPDFNIHYKETNLQSKATISTNAQGYKTYSWQISNLKAIKDEPFSPYPVKFLSSVQIAPEKFIYYGIGGYFTNWKDLGKWEYDKLVASRQQLPHETVDHIRELTDSITDPRLKAKKIYEYMQGKTHYISVQIGIGGYQPFLASEVDRQNYGDCKALVNYTQALLKAVNIESYYCIVEAGRKYKVSLAKDFPSMEQGNHAILCLPFKNDTTWADCTNQTIPFGYLGDFTDDRTVLACTPEGGKLMHTPKYTYQDNLKKREANFSINEVGGLNGDMTTTFKGADYDERDYMMGEPKSEQYKMVQREYPINNMDIACLAIKQDKSRDPFTKEDIKLQARDYASYTDGKYYFLLNPVNRVNEPPKQVRNRINPVYINRGFTDEDDIIYTIPKGYHLEKAPLDISIDKPYARFSAHLIFKGDQLFYHRKFQLIDGTYSKDTYADLVDFYQQVVDADEYNIVLIK